MKVYKPQKVRQELLDCSLHFIQFHSNLMVGSKRVLVNMDYSLLLSHPSFSGCKLLRADTFPWYTERLGWCWQ